MPSIASHLACAKLISEKLDINNDDFYIGNILPDIIDLPNSHYKIRGSYYLIPDIDYFTKKFDLNNYINMGYLTHLLLDKYFLEEFVPNNIKNYKKINLFTPNMMYEEYTNLNMKLINEFALDLNYINKIMQDINIPLNKNKYLSNIKSINNPETNDKLKIINLKEYINFLNDISDKIVNYIKEV